MTALGVLSVAALILGALPAQVIDDGAPGLLVLEASPSPFEVELVPGDRSSLAVSASLDAADPATLTLEIDGWGPLADDPGGLRLEVRECTAPWTEVAADPACPGTVSSIVAEGALAGASADVRQLGRLVPGTARHFLATLSLPDPAPGGLMGARGEFLLRFEAAGDVEVSGSGMPGTHPVTGIAVALPLAIAVALGGVGVTLGCAARRRGGAS